MRTLLALIFVCIVYSAFSQPIQRPKGYQDKYFKEMRYGFFKPTSYDVKKTYPLILYLHGSTDTTSWDFSWYHNPVQTEDPCFVLSPKTTDPNGGWGNNWNNIHTIPMKITLELLDSIIKEYNIDTTRLYVTGTSMGGFGTFSVLQKEEGKFAAAYIVCGGGDPKFASKYLKTPLWIFHGEIDNVVPIKLSKNVYNEMIKLDGKNVRYTEYPGVKHNSWENVGKEPNVTKWLMMQRKGSIHKAPNPVKNLTASSPKDGKVELEWTAGNRKVNTDTDIWYFKLYKDNVLIKEINDGSTSYTDTEIKRGKKYKYSIIAVNYFFKESPAVEAK